MPSKKIYSLDRDVWVNPVENADEIIELAIDNNQDFVFIGECSEIGFNAFLNVDSLIEAMQDHALSEYDDLAENYLRDVTDDQLKELESVICAWADKHNLKPSFYDVENIKEISVKELSNG